MIVCHCNVVRERTIERAIRRGATTLAEVQAECGASARCGGCEPAVLEMLAGTSTRSQRYESVVAVAL